MMPEELFSRDDIFLIGNIAGRAIYAGRGGEAQMLLRFLQVERPQNAGPHLLQATYLHSVDQLDDAIDYLEHADMFRAEQNGAETFVFFLELLFEREDFNRVCREVRDYRAKSLHIPMDIEQRMRQTSTK